MQRLTNITLSGYKSIGREQNICFGDVTVFLGANGCGKSNLISFFRMLNYMSTGGLQHFIAQNGRANSLLHFGPPHTQKISFTVNFRDDDWTDSYIVTLSYGMPDSLFISSEKIHAKQDGNANPPITGDLTSPERFESNLRNSGTGNIAIDKACHVLQSQLSRC